MASSQAAGTELGGLSPTTSEDDVLLAALGLATPDVDLLAEDVRKDHGRAFRPTKSQRSPRQPADDVGADEAPTPSASTRYRRLIQSYPLLDAGQEIQLAKEIEAGVLGSAALASARTARARREYEHLIAQGEVAFDRMVVSNLRLVYYIAARYQGRGLDLDDLVQEGSLGLMRAVHKFDFAQGFRFSTYATWWIRQAITRALADQRRTIRLPAHVEERLGRVERARADLPPQLRDEVVRERVAEELALNPNDVHQLLLWARRTWSLDELVEGGLLDETDQLMALDEVVEQGEVRRAVGEALRVLRERSRDVVVLRYGLDGCEPRTLEEVGNIFGFTRERARQIESKAKTRLQERAADGLAWLL